MSASTVLGAVLVLAAVALIAVGVLGWRERLPRNRFAGVRTPATLRSDTAFTAANRVAGPPVAAAGAVAGVGGALAFGSTGAPLAVVVGVTALGTLLLMVAGGLLGHRAATAVPAPAPTPRGGGCAGCACGAGGCSARTGAAEPAGGQFSDRSSG